MSDVSRVLFPADANSAVAALASVYASYGKIAAVVLPKQELPVRLGPVEADALARQGALVLHEAGAASLEIVAIGAYQLQQAERAWQRLQERGMAVRLVYVQEPGRFRSPRDTREAAACVLPEDRSRLFAAGLPRIIISHSRPELMGGLLHEPDGGRTALLGYRNQGGTLDTEGMLYANGCTWAHVVAAGAALLHRAPAHFLGEAEWLATQGSGDPYCLISAPHPMS